MDPLTQACARTRRELDAYHQGELEAAASAAVAEHLAGCPPCRASSAELDSALQALAGLNADERAWVEDRLATADGARGLGEPLDTGPLTRLVFVALTGVLVLFAGAALVLRGPQAPSGSSGSIAQGRVAIGPATPQLLAARAEVPLPTVGAEVGIELEPVITAGGTFGDAPRAGAVMTFDPGPERDGGLALTAGAARDAGADAAAVGGDPAEREVAPRAGAGGGMAGAPGGGMAGGPGGGAGGAGGGGAGAAGGGGAGAAPGGAAAKLDPPRPLPDDVAQGLERLQLSLGLGYQELTVFFVRDPSGRDRLPSSSGAAELTVRESAPATPETCAVRPARSGDLVLTGELLDAPLGPRIALETRRLGSGTEDVPVLALAWDALSPPRRSAPFRAPALVTSAARLALLRDEQPGPVAVLLQDLSEHARGQPERFLHLELNRLEAEARELERRLRAMVRNTRGLRGVGFSISDGARSLDVFADARDLSASFPRLLRGALLEAALEGDQRHELPSGDTGPRTIREGVRTSRDAHEGLLGLLRGVTAPPASKPGEALVTLTARGGKDRPGSALVRLEGDGLLHGVSIAEVGRGSRR